MGMYNHIRREIEDADQRRKERLERDAMRREAKRIYQEHVVESDRYRVS